MTKEEKYKRFEEKCHRRGIRVYDKPDIYDEMRRRNPPTAVSRSIIDCEPLLFIIDNEFYHRVGIDDPEGFDIFIIPYKGYVDRDVEYANSIGAKIWDLEDFIKKEGDFEMSSGPEDKNPMSIRKYIDNFDYAKFVMCDKAAIYLFRDEYFFLSNFYICNVKIDGVIYTSAEAAFQAQKCVNPEEKKRFIDMTPNQAKKYGKTVKLRPDWEDVKISIMKEIVSQKFLQNPTLLEKLMSTDNRLIVEGNAWRDTFWGVSHGKGKNNLGKILMEVREAYKQI